MNSHASLLRSEAATTLKASWVQREECAAVFTVNMQQETSPALYSVKMRAMATSTSRLSERRGQKRFAIAVLIFDPS